MTRIAMPPGMPLRDARRAIVGRGFWMDFPTADGVDATTSTRATATCTASATPHTKGPWTQVIAATTVDATMVALAIGGTSAFNGVNASATDTSTLIDVGIGGSGSEVALISNLPVGYGQPGAQYEIPVLVPQGARVSIRAQSVVVSQQVTVSVRLSTLPNGKRSPNHLVTMGADTASSHGVVLAVPGVVNTKGAWTELSAATAEAFGALAVGMQGGADTTLIGGGVLFDIGLGPAGQEVVRLADLYCGVSGSEMFARGYDPLMPIDIPAGSRIAARYQTNNLGTSMDVIVIGVPRQ